MPTSFFGGAFFGGEFFSAPTGVTQAITPIIGGGIPHDYPRTKKDIRRARERFGIPDEERLEAERVVAEIAKRQAEKLELDAQKRFEELSRELQLRDIQWEASYLESLNTQRQKLIDAELYDRFKKFRDEQDIALLILMASCV